jgi:16S rRNA (uracil1498-N3)-methyltransferase
MIRCFVPAVSADRVSLPSDEAHHVTRVLRLGVGAAIVMFDGRGHEWDARIAAVDRHDVTIEIVASKTPVAEPVVAVTLAVALLKGDQMATVVRDATALGVAAIQPFVSSHVTVPERAWRDRSIERWQRVAIASAKQCGRSVVPVIHDVLTYPDVLDRTGDDLVMCCVEPALGVALEMARPLARPSTGRAWLCIGPEGGWSEQELALARQRHVTLIGLGPRTLRAEIAPTVALSALWTRWGWDGTSNLEL